MNQHWHKSDAQSLFPFISDQRFRRTERLLKRHQFARTRRSGKKRVGKRLVVYAAPNDLKWSRLGITTSRKVGNAVIRNRWKRHIREAFRLNKQAFAPGFDFVVIVKHKKLPVTFESVCEELLKHAEQAVKRR